MRYYFYRSKIIDERFRSLYSLSWVHDSMAKVEFKPGSIKEDIINSLFDCLIDTIEKLGFTQI